MIANLGDWVITKRHEHIGRVHAKHTYFYTTGQSHAWFQQQGLPEETKEQPWYSVLIHGGGGCCVPESDIDKVAAVEEMAEAPLYHPWAKFYFGG